MGRGCPRDIIVSILNRQQRASACAPVVQVLLSLGETSAHILCLFLSRAVWFLVAVSSFKRFVVILAYQICVL